MGGGGFPWALAWLAKNWWRVAVDEMRSLRMIPSQGKYDSFL